MYRIISYEEIKIKEIISDYKFIDCRSPFEFNEDSIPNSINLPVFTNEERIEVGTLYKQASVEKARALGVSIVSQKLPQLYNEIVELKKKYKNLIFYCSKGGYRSTSIISLLDAIGHKNLYKLDNGYKGYRKFVNDTLPCEVEKINLIVLYGNTGSGKTKILNAIEKMDYDTIDLEGYANHRGSTLGGVGLGKQNTQKKFETLLLDKILNRKSDILFTEGESRRIGRVLIPKYFFDKMLDGAHIKIETDIDMRIKIILEDYITKDTKEILEALEYLRKMLGNKLVDKYIDLVKEGKYEYVIKDLMLNYYDPMYEHNKHNYLKTFKNINIKDTAKDIIMWSKENEKGIHN